MRALAAALLAVTPLGMPGAWELADPPHDVEVDRGWLLLTVDSVDLTGARLERQGEAVVGGAMAVVDLAHRGPEDASFAPGTHHVREWVLAAELGGNPLRTLFVLAGVVEPAYEGRSWAAGAVIVETDPQGNVVAVVPIATELEVDAASSVLRWRLAAPVDETAALVGARAQLLGCEPAPDGLACGPRVEALPDAEPPRGVLVLDGAPGGLGEVALPPALAWSQVFWWGPPR